MERYCLTGNIGATKHVTVEWFLCCIVRNTYQALVLQWHALPTVNQNSTNELLCAVTMTIAVECLSNCKL